MRTKSYFLELVWGKPLSAVLALKPFDLEMCFKMLLQVSLLRKSFLAVFILASIWFFFSMDSLMFYEVVPFSKGSVTIDWSTLQNLHVLHCERVLKFVDSKLFGLWNDFINFDLGDIEFWTLKYFYNCILRYLFFYLLVSYLISCHFLSRPLELRNDGLWLEFEVYIVIERNRLSSDVLDSWFVTINVAQVLA